MRKPILAILATILASLSCTQVVATATPTVSPSATPAPTRTAKPTPSPTVQADNQTATVKAALVNVRQSPNGEVIGQLEAGQSVTIIECKDDWCHISDPDGWVFQGCLSVAVDQGCEAK